MTTTTARNFGSKATEARIAARVASDYTREAWQADKASQRTNRSQEAAMSHTNAPHDAATGITKPASQRSIDFLVSLSASRTPHVTESVIRGWAATAGQRAVSDKIGALKAMPVVEAKADTFNEDWAAMKGEAAKHEARQEQAAYEAKARRDDTTGSYYRDSIVASDRTPAVATVPAGRYAVTGEDGATKFYRVDRPTEGRWAGYVFVKVQAGDELHSLRGSQARDGVLRKIAEAGVEAAMLRYGRELGHCGHCGRTLTNEASRERGIGPICAGKMGW